MESMKLDLQNSIKQGAEARVFLLPLNEVLPCFEKRGDHLQFKGEIQSDDTPKRKPTGTVRGELITDFSSILKDDVNKKQVIVKERFSKAYRNPILDARLTKKRVFQEGRALRKLTDHESNVPVPKAYGSNVKTGVLFMEYIEGESVKSYIDKFQYLLDFTHKTFGKIIQDDDTDDENELDNESGFEINDNKSKRIKKDDEKDIDVNDLLKDLNDIVNNNQVSKYHYFIRDNIEKFLPNEITYEIFVKYLLSLYEIFYKIGDYLGRIHANDMVHGDLTTSNIMIRDKINDQEKIMDRIVFIDFGLSYNTNIIEDKAVDMYVLERTLISSHHNSKFLFEILITGYLNTYKDIGKQIKNKFEQVRLRGRKRTEFG